MKFSHILLWSCLALPLAQAQNEETPAPAEPTTSEDGDKKNKPSDESATDQPAESEEPSDEEVSNDDAESTADAEASADAEVNDENKPGDEDESKDAEEKVSDPIVIRTEIPKTVRLSEDNSTLKLLAPWAPKPMQRAPMGWTYVPGDPEQAYKREVKLSTGKSVILTIIPYVLEPEESEGTVQILEPGYQPERGYKQRHSVTAVLSESSKSLEKAVTTLDNSINTLSELVNSLPKQDPAAPKPSTPKPANQ